MANIIECAFLVVLALAFLRIALDVVGIYRDRRRATKKLQETIDSLRVGQVWYSGVLLSDNPFRESRVFYSRITDIRRNHRGVVWVEFCYRDQPVIKALSADRFLKVYPILSDNE